MAQGLAHTYLFCLTLAELGLNHVVSLILMLGGLLLLVLAVLRAPRAQRPAGPHAPPAPVAHLSKDPRVESAVREAQELADLFAEQVERQASRLERLIADADARIRQLERLSESPVASRIPDDDTDPLNRRVYDLADGGMPPVEIARTLHQQTGKVELILALRQR